MLVGHVAIAFVAKGLQPRLSLGTAVAAAIAADVLLFSFVLAGVEHVQFRTSLPAGELFTGSNLALSHSLAMSVVWGAAIAAAARRGRRDTHAAALIVAVAVSHWVLDVISHRPFMPLAPGVVRQVGWTAFPWIVPMMAIEGAIWGAAVVRYVSDSRSVNSAGRYVFWGGVASLTYVWYVNVFGPPRGNPQQDAPIEGLILLLLTIAWAYWMNRARTMKAGRLGMKEGRP
jgi:hypothetical protein